MFSYPKILSITDESGLPNNPTSTLRIGAKTLSGKVSYHAKGDAVDFWGESQDELARFWLGQPHREVFHKSLKTGEWYGSSNGQPVDAATHPELVKQHENHVHVAATNEDVGGAALGAVGSVLSPFGAAASLVDVFKPIGVVALNLASGSFWRRIGMGVVGSALVMAGLLFLLGRRLEGKIAPIIGGAANSALQGASFGFGAAKAGMGGAIGPAPASGGGPSAGPYPPRPGRRALPSEPVTAVPTTAVLPEAYAPVSAGGTYSVTAVGRATNPGSPGEYTRPGGSLIDTAAGRKGTSTGRKPKPKNNPVIITGTVRDT